MSIKKTSIRYAAAAVVVALAIIAASTIYLGIPVPSFQSSSSVQAGQVLAIRLTDPPQVPHLTSSLNLTYSSISLLVGEPTGTPGQLDTKSVAVTPSGGSATVDLLRLQNVSETIALAKLPNDSVLYSVTFTVTSIKIDVNGTISSVSLATGGSSFGVTIARPSALSGGDFALLQLNPVVVDTPSGYQLIPSAVGLIRPSEGQQGENEQVGSQHQLTREDDQNLKDARGNVTASLIALSVSGNVTSVTVRVNNTGSVPVSLMGIGLHGNFTVVGNACQSAQSTTTETETETHTTETHTTITVTETHTETTSSEHECEIPEHTDQVVFVPLAPSSSTTTTTSATCSSGSMGLVNGEDVGDHGGLTLNAGKCVDLTFVGKISFGEAQFVLVPSTSAGQTYILHVIASNGANEQLSCTLPLGASSCKALPQESEQQD